MAPPVADWRLTHGHQSQTFLPVAEELIDSVSSQPTSSTSATWGPATTPRLGKSLRTPSSSPSRLGCSPGAVHEAGGAGEDYEMRLWIHHGTSGMPHLPKTGDVVEYDAPSGR